jgi:hypothetical protein
LSSGVSLGEGAAMTTKQLEIALAIVLAVIGSSFPKQVAWAFLSVAAILVLLFIYQCLAVPSSKHARADSRRAIVAVLFAAPLLGYLTYKIPLWVEALTPGELIREVDFGALTNSEYEPAPFAATMGQEGYRELFHVVASWKARHPGEKLSSFDPAPPAGLWSDLVQVTIWRWLAVHYRTHWDIRRDRLQTFAGSGESQRTQDGAEASPKILPEEATRKFLSGNRFADMAHGVVAVPAGSIVEVDRGGSRIMIRTRTDSALVIELGVTAAQTVDRTPFGDMHIVPRFGSGLTEHHSKITIRYSYQGRPPVRERRWADEFMTWFHRDFDWAPIRAALVQPAP